MKTRLTCLFLSSVALTGCQIAGVKGYPLHRAELVDVVTVPVGATATSVHGESCVTPCKLSLLSGRGGKITVEMDGYYTEQVKIGSRVDDVAVGLQALGAVANAIEPDPVDIAIETVFGVADPEGQIKKLDTNRVTLSLVPFGSPAPLDDEEEEFLDFQYADDTGEAADLPG